MGEEGLRLAASVWGCCIRETSHRLTASHTHRYIEARRPEVADLLCCGARLKTGPRLQ